MLRAMCVCVCVCVRLTCRPDTPPPPPRRAGRWCRCWCRLAGWPRPRAGPGCSDTLRWRPGNLWDRVHISINTPHFSQKRCFMSKLSTGRYRSRDRSECALVVSFKYYVFFLFCFYLQVKKITFTKSVFNVNFVF